MTFVKSSTIACYIVYLYFSECLKLKVKTNWAGKMNNRFENLNYGKLSVASVLLFGVIATVMGVSYAWVQKKEGYKE